MGLVQILKKSLLFFSGACGRDGKTIGMSDLGFFTVGGANSGRLQIIQKISVQLKFRAEQCAAGTKDFGFGYLCHNRELPGLSKRSNDRCGFSLISYSADAGFRQAGMSGRGEFIADF